MQSRRGSWKQRRPDFDESQFDFVRYPNCARLQKAPRGSFVRDARRQRISRAIVAFCSEVEGTSSYPLATCQRQRQRTGIRLQPSEGVDPSGSGSNEICRRGRLSCLPCSTLQVSRPASRHPNPLENQTQLVSRKPGREAITRPEWPRRKLRPWLQNFPAQESPRAPLPPTIIRSQIEGCRG